MFHFSTDRLAGLDNMILKITSPQKVPTLIPNHQHDAYAPVGKPKKQKDGRVPLADKTASSNLIPSSMLLHVPGEVKLVYSPDTPSFRPLPPLPSASTLQLPSFLNFSSESVTEPFRRSTASLPASALFRASSSAAPSSRRAAVRKSKAPEGPQWIPAFHHPNSPYVPWSSPVRRRILPPPSPVPPSLLSLSSPRIRSGAVAPEPWASSVFSQVHATKSKREKIASSWKSFKKSIKQSVKYVVSHLGKSPRAPCTSQDVLCTFDTEPRSSEPHDRDSLASFVSSDSRTLAAWLAERRANASCVADNMPVEMSVEEYEVVGSWLDLRHCDGGWLCGIQDCDVHTAGGSPCAGSEHPDGLRTAMPFDSMDLLLATPESPALSFPSPAVRPRFYSLPRLPCQSFDLHPAQDTGPVALQQHAVRCLTKCRELSMPGGWTFN